MAAQMSNDTQCLTPDRNHHGRPLSDCVEDEYVQEYLWQLIINPDVTHDELDEQLSTYVCDANLRTQLLELHSKAILCNYEPHSRTIICKPEPPDRMNDDPHPVMILTHTQNDENELLANDCGDVQQAAKTAVCDERVKKSILQKYDLYEVRDSGKKNISHPNGRSDLNWRRSERKHEKTKTSTLRYYNGQIVTTKGEKYVSM